MSASLLINEIFFSIQGESSFAGQPCAFIRLTGCNLRCKWCDTEYAFYEGTRMSLDEIFQQVSNFPTRLVEVTGGEPLAQAEVHLLLERLLDSGKTVLVETGGHMDIQPVDDRAILIYDIKCPDSGMADQNRWENLTHLKKIDEIKLVIASRQDYEWARKTVVDRKLTPRHRVIFSPVWGILDPAPLADWILEDGLPVQMQIQLHKLLWGPDARSV